MNLYTKILRTLGDRCVLHKHVSFLMCKNYVPRHKEQLKCKENAILVPLVSACLALSGVTKTKNKPATTSDVEDNILHLITLARIALEKGDTERAEGILQMGLKISDDHKVYLGIPYIYDILAAIAFANGNLGNAEQLLVNVIEKLIQVGVPENSNDIVDFKLRLARIYSSYEESNLAEIGFRTCLNEQKSKITSGDFSSKTGILYINILFWYALHKIRLEEYSDAKKMLNAAYEYSHKIEGLSPYQEMVLLYTLADLNMTLGDNIAALEIMQNTILMANAIGTPELPKCYVKLAKIYTRMNSAENAKSSAVEAAKLAKMFSDQEVYIQANKLIEEIEKEKK